MSCRINFNLVHIEFCSKLFLILCLHHYWDEYKNCDKQNPTNNRERLNILRLAFFLLQIFLISIYINQP